MYDGAALVLEDLNPALIAKSKKAAESNSAAFFNMAER